MPTNLPEYRRHWESINKEKRREYNRRARDKNREWFLNYRSSLSCIVCGESEGCCIDFHHIDPNQKEYEIARIWNVTGMKKLKEELEKTVPLCANCHRKFHAGIIKNLPL